MGSSLELKCLIHHNALTSHATHEAPIPKLTIAERYSLLKNSYACYGCLFTGHQIKECPNRIICGDECEKYHHRSLHDDNHSGTSNSITNSAETEHPLCILHIMKVRIFSPYYQFWNTLWDSGASITLIPNSKAELLRLIGKPVQLSVTKVGGTEETTPKIYNIPLVDINGQRLHIKAYGIDKITNGISFVKLDNIVHLFANVTSVELERPSGTVDLLIGYEYASLHPVRKTTIKW